MGKSMHGDNKSNDIKKRRNFIHIINGKKIEKITQGTLKIFKR